MTLSRFKNMGRDYAKRLRYPYLQEYEKEDAMDIAHLEFKMKIADKKEMVGENSLTEIMSQVLGVNIYVLDKRLKLSRKFEEVCEAFENEDSIILYTPDDVYYQPVYVITEDEKQYVFGDHDLTNQFYNELCT